MKYIPDYNDPKILKNYAIWYYSKYLPSINKLKSKLIRKNPDNKVVRVILIELNELFKENEIISSQIRNYFDNGKSEKYIRQKLLLKWFEIEMIEKNLLSVDSNELIENQKKTIINKINSLKYKKSKQLILQNIYRLWYDKNLISEVIGEFLFDDGNLINKEFEKLEKTNIPKEKIIQKLISKWFRYDDIKKLFSN